VDTAKGLAFLLWSRPKAPYEWWMGMSNKRDADDLPPTTNSKICVGCGTVAPPTDSEHTLISMKHGWRVSRAVDGKGRSGMVWRCPTCWTEFRAKGQLRK
jgi:hypothetical protein